MFNSRFKFLDPGLLLDGELELVLRTTQAPDPYKGYSPTYVFNMQVRDPECLEAAIDWPGREVGTVSLRIGHTENLEKYAGHIGYGVHPEFRGRHYAGRACRLLLPLAKRHGLDVLWITCNPDNLASRRTCEWLGAQLVEIVRVPASHELYALGDREKCRYRLENQ